MQLRVAFMLVCACFAGVQPLFAQAPVQPPALQRAEPSGQTAMVYVLDLTPNAAERFARALQLSYGIADVADFRVIKDAFEPNPDEALRKATVAVRGAALFRTASDIRSAFATVADNVTTFKEFAAVADPFVGDDGDTILRNLARGRRRDWLARFIGAFTASASWSDRPRLDSFGLTPPADPRDTTKFSFDATLDSAVLFRGATDRKAGYEAFSAYLRLFPTRAGSLTQSAAPCNGTARDCIRRITGLSGMKALFGSLIPTIKLESIDEFDYATVAGQPILFPKPIRDGVLTTYTVTWDLQKIVKGTDMRTEAVNAYKAFKTLSETMTKSAALLTIAPIALRLNEFQVIQLTASYSGAGGPTTAEGVAWKRPKEGRWIEGLYLTPEGLLVGIPTCSGTCDGIDLVLTYGTERKPMAASVTISGQ